MRNILSALLVAASCSILNAQMERNNSEISFSKEPIATLDKDIVGWVKAIDGQWKSAEQTILDNQPEDNDYRQKHKEIGQDNFVAMHVYDMWVDGKRLWVYVKFFKNGYYRYEQRKKGWRGRLDAYFYLVDPLLLPDLNDLKDNIPYTYLIPTMGAGKFQNIRKKDIIEKIKSTLTIPLHSDRLMAIQLRVDKESNKAQFQISSMHKVFSGTDGIVMDFHIRDRSVYGKNILFDHFYYETSFLHVLNILPSRKHLVKQPKDLDSIESF